MNYNNLCFRCFSERPAEEKICPKCGYKHTPEAIKDGCLRPGTLLKNRYIVGVALGVGGFGITYKCLDTKIGGICAIKEYFPVNIALRRGESSVVYVSEQNSERYNKIMKRFVEEAVLLRSLKHKNVIGIYDSFHENNTAYYVMEYCDGIDLRKYTQNFTRKLGCDEGMNILFQVMNGLEYIHASGIMHRDIAPDNIYITKGNIIKILDFGAARNEMDQYKRELSVIVKVGYAPIEQYGGRSKQGPYTDIYALGATFYHLFTGRIPEESTQRVAGDGLIPFSQLRPDLPDTLKFCIERAMEVTTSKRIQNIAEMKRILGISNESLRQSQLRKLSDDNARREQARKAYEGAKAQAKAQVQAQAQNVSSGSSFTRSWQQSGSITPYPRKKAGLGIRFGAAGIDLGIWLSTWLMLMVFILNPIVLLVSTLFIFPFVFVTANAIFEMCMSKTIGKAILGLRVSDGNGADLPSGKIWLRNIVKLVGWASLLSVSGDEFLEDKATASAVYHDR